MHSVHDVLTGMEQTSELNGLREVLCCLLYPSSSKVIVLNEEARGRALQKRMEQQHARSHNVRTHLGTAS
jgi:hypothetical protein